MGDRNVSKNLLTTPAAFQQAMTDFQNLPEFKGKKVLIFQYMTVMDNTINLDAVKPGTKDVDHYEYASDNW